MQTIAPKNQETSYRFQNLQDCFESEEFKTFPRPIQKAVFIWDNVEGFSKFLPIKEALLSHGINISEASFYRGLRSFGKHHRYEILGLPGNRKRLSDQNIEELSKLWNTRKDPSQTADTFHQKVRFFFFFFQVFRFVNFASFTK